MSTQGRADFRESTAGNSCLVGKISGLSEGSMQKTIIKTRAIKILQFQIPKGTTYSVGAYVSCIVNKYLYEWINWWFECFTKITTNRSHVKICTISLSKKWHTIGSYLRIMGIIKNFPLQMKCKLHIITMLHTCVYVYMCTKYMCIPICVYKMWINFSPWSMNSYIVSLCFSSLKIFLGT